MTKPIFDQIQSNSPFGWMLEHDSLDDEMSTRLCVMEVKTKDIPKKLSPQNHNILQAYLSEHIFTWFASVAEDSTDPVLGKSGFVFMNPITFIDYVTGYGSIVYLYDKTQNAKGNVAGIGDTKIFVSNDIDPGVVYFLPDPDQVATANLGFHLESEDKGWVTITTGIQIVPVEKPIVKKYRVEAPWRRA